MIVKKGCYNFDVNKTVLENIRALCGNVIPIDYSTAKLSGDTSENTYNNKLTINGIGFYPTTKSGCEITKYCTDPYESMKKITLEVEQETRRGDRKRTYLRRRIPINNLSVNICTIRRIYKEFFQIADDLNKIKKAAKEKIEFEAKEKRDFFSASNLTPSLDSVNFYGDNNQSVRLGLFNLTRDEAIMIGQYAAKLRNNRNV